MQGLFPIRGAIVCCVLQMSNIIRKPIGRLAELVKTVVLPGISVSFPE
jgi:hypothetical protein